jgi:hypothetical protein
MTDAIALAEALVAVERDLDAKGQAIVAGLKVKTAEGAVVEVEMSEGVVGWVDTTPIQLDALSQQVSAADAQIADLAQRWDTQPLVGLLQRRYMRELDFTQNIKSLAERVHLMEADGNLIGLREELKALQRSIDAQLNALDQDDHSTIEALVQQQEQAITAKVQEAINTPPTTFTIDLTEDELAMFQAKQREVDDLKVKLAQVEVVNKNLTRERDEMAARLHPKTMGDTAQTLAILMRKMSGRMRHQGFTEPTAHSQSPMVEIGGLSFALGEHGGLVAALLPKP